MGQEVPLPVVLGRFTYPCVKDFVVLWYEGYCFSFFESVICSLSGFYTLKENIALLGSNLITLEIFQMTVIFI